MKTSVVIIFPGIILALFVVAYVIKNLALMTAAFPAGDSSSTAPIPHLVDCHCLQPRDFCPRLLFLGRSAAKKKLTDRNRKVGG